jgi:hypothetical protein
VQAEVDSKGSRAAQGEVLAFGTYLGRVVSKITANASNRQTGQPNLLLNAFRDPDDASNGAQERL